MFRSNRFAIVGAVAVFHALCSTAAVFASDTQSAPGTPQIDVGETVTISADVPDVAHGESFLAANPRNTANMIASAVKVDHNGAGSSVYATQDGGRTWQRGVLTKGAEKLATGWDAIVYFDGEGMGYFGSNDGDGLWISRSTDNGRTWGPATLIAGAEGFDRQYMAFDRSGRFKGRVYAAASVTTVDFEGRSRLALAIAPSTDGGATFGQPYLIRGLGDEDPFTFANMLVARDGTAIFPFTTTTREDPADLNALWQFRVAVSKDGGRAYTISPPITAFRKPSEVYRATKTLGGFASAIDLSDGPFAGRVYLTWTEVAGERNDVKLIYSSDMGENWSAPVTVNDNPGPADHSNPTIAVNKDGVVCLIWNDRRDHENACYDVYFSASLDGGKTFLPNVATGQASTCPTAAGNWTARSTVVDYPRSEDGVEMHGQGLNVLMISTRFPNGGESQGLVSDAGGVFHAAWIDGSSGVMRLAATPFVVKSKPDAAAATARNVSLQVKLEAESCAFDWTANTFSCAMHLENRSKSPAAGPFAVILKEMRVNLPGFAATGADNGQTGVGALWNFPIQGKKLAPEGKSRSRTLTWEFTGMSEEPNYPFRLFDVVQMPK